MVVKILKVKKSDGTILEGRVAMVNKSGSFQRIYDSNEDMEKLIETYGTPFYANIVPTDRGVKCTGIVRGSF